MKQRATKLLAMCLAVTMAVSPTVELRAETLEMTEPSTEEFEKDQTAEVIVEETAQELVEEAVNESAEELVEETAKESAEKMVEEPAEENVSEIVAVQNVLETVTEQVIEDTQAQPCEEQPADAEEKLSLFSVVIDDTKYDDGCYDIDLSSDFSMFKVLDPKATIKGESIIVTFHTAKNTYDKIYLGYQTDEVKDPYILGEKKEDEDGYRFTFEVPLAQMGQTIPFVPGKPDGTWYKNKNGKEYYLTIPKVLTDPEMTFDEGDYTIDMSSDFAMFKILEPKAVVSGDKITVTFYTAKDTYDKFYFGLQTDEVKEPYIQGIKREGEDGYEFTFQLPTSKMGQTVPFVPGKPDGTWYKNKNGKEYYMTIPSVLTGTAEPTPTPEATPTPTPEATPTPTPDVTPQVPGDGNYSVSVESSAAMFKVVDCVLISKNGKMTAVITLSGTGYDYLYVGTGEDAAKADKSAWVPAVINKEGKYTYIIPVSALDTPIAIAAHSTKNDKWYDRELTFQSESLNKIWADGNYATTVESSAAMFKVIDCVLTLKNGKMTAVITLSGTGYNYLYVGTGEDAAKADKSAWVPAVINKEGKYTYTIPVSAFDTPIAIAAHSIKNDKWYDRSLTFHSDTLKKIDGSTPIVPENPGESTKPDSGSTGESTKPDSGSTGETTKPETNPDTTPDTESNYESDTSGSTSSVNSSTSLSDGVYTPDRFSWSGGTGRVSLSCSKVTVKNGQAFATIVFGSDAYKYIKANGRTYYGNNGGGVSTFVIPVELNKNNRILGMTAKMTASHEIEYSIFVYIAAAANTDSALGENSNEKLDDKAPQIMGLEYESETELQHAEYFKIYHYQDGITLLEIDMTKDTARDPEKQSEDIKLDSEEASEESRDAKAEKIETGKETDEATTIEDEAAEDGLSEEIVEADAELIDEDAEESIQTDAEIAAELYKGNVVKYLIVPEDVEIPVGLDKEMIVVQLPADKAYVASKEALDMMDELELLEQIAAVGFEQEDCELEEITAAMEDEKVSFAGTYEEPDYKALLKAKVNFAVLPDEILPMEEEDIETEDKKTEDKKTEDVTKGKDAEAKLTVEEQTRRLEEMTERFATLGIPVLVDRSKDEEEELAKLEWIKVYGILFGCEEAAEKLFEEAVEAK